jgi:hypothetical protein
MKGWTPAWTRLLPNTVAIFLLQEQFKHWIDVMRGDDDP